MFTGIVTGTGTVKAKRKLSAVQEFQIAVGTLARRLKLGDSLSVNGVCLTVARKSGTTVTVQVVNETLRATNIGELETGDKVNLEPSLRLGDAVGGHFVTGHVDATGRIAKKEAEGESFVLHIKAPKVIIRHLIQKGSVAVDGISLTVQSVAGDSFKVALIPHTLEVTNLKYKAPGDSVNLETDQLAKYMEKFSGASESPQLTEAFLREQGY